MQSAVAYIITPSGNCHNHFALQDGLQLAKRTPYLHLDCNIPHNRQIPDALWSKKHIEIKFLAQGYKHAG